MALEVAGSTPVGLPIRGCSSDGRALEWHSRGQGFDSPQLHQVPRAVAQLGSALPWGGRGRGFKSRQPDQFGVWLSLVERTVRDREVAGSNPVTPTKSKAGMQSRPAFDLGGPTALCGAKGERADQQHLSHPVHACFRFGGPDSPLRSKGREGRPTTPEPSRACLPSFWGARQPFAEQRAREPTTSRADQIQTRDVQRHVFLHVRRPPCGGGAGGVLRLCSGRIRP